MIYLTHKLDQNTTKSFLSFFYWNEVSGIKVVHGRKKNIKKAHIIKPIYIQNIKKTVRVSTLI